MNTNLTDLHDYLQLLIKSTNMKCLTPEKVYAFDDSNHDSYSVDLHCYVCLL